MFIKILKRTSRLFWLLLGLSSTALLIIPLLIFKTNLVNLESSALKIYQIYSITALIISIASFFILILKSRLNKQKVAKTKTLKEIKKPKKHFFKKRRLLKIGLPILGIILILGFNKLYYSAEKENMTTPKSIKQKKSTKQEKKTVQECIKEETLEKAKNCTFVVTTDIAHGSSFAVEEEYLITNFHVIEGGNSINTRVNGEEIGLDLWGYDETSDLAVLKLPEDYQNVALCNWEDSTDIPLAAEVYAIGWPHEPEGESSITKGIYSRHARTEEGPIFIQTDSPINPGNSGGPLLTECGIVGINTWKVSWSSDERPSEGYGFAIASEYAEERVNKLIEEGSVKELPVGNIEQIKLTPKKAQQRMIIYDEEYLETFSLAKRETYEMYNYWLDSDREGYDSKKLQTLQDYVAKMKRIVDRTEPKILNQLPMTQEEHNMIETWSSYIERARELEKELEGHTYSGNYEYHAECVNNTCQLVEGKGKDECSSHIECQPEYHTECRDMKCVIVEGKGENECNSNLWCELYGREK